MTLTFDLTHNLDLGCFKVKFRNSCISGIGRLIDVKWNGSELIRYWADYMTLIFDHTHDLDLGVSSSESEIALSQEWDGRLAWNEKDVSHPFMTMILTSVTMLRWADVPDSDRGDFRRRHAVDISSLQLFAHECSFMIHSNMLQLQMPEFPSTQNIRAWISSHIHCITWDVITQSCINFNYTLIKLSLKSKHGSEITFCCTTWM